MSIHFINEDKFWNLKVDADYQHEQCDNGYVFFENEADMDAFVDANPDLAELDKAILDELEGRWPLKRNDGVTVEYDSRGGKELHFGQTALEVALAAQNEDSPDFFGDIYDIIEKNQRAADCEYTSEEDRLDYLEEIKTLQGYLDEGYTHIYVPEGSGLAGAEVFRDDASSVSIMDAPGRLRDKTFTHYSCYLEIPLKN